MRMQWDHDATGGGDLADETVPTRLSDVLRTKESRVVYLPGIAGDSDGALDVALDSVYRATNNKGQSSAILPRATNPKMAVRRRVTGSRSSVIASVDASGLRCIKADLHVLVRGNSKHEKKQPEPGGDERM